jgi:hypothetical protein
VLYEFLNIKKKPARFYNIIFVSRRVIFLTVSLFSNENGAVLLVINLLIDLVYVIYMGYAKAFKKRSLNRQDMFNECIVSASFYWKILYTSVV